MTQRTVLTDEQIIVIVTRLYESTKSDEIGSLKARADIVPLGKAIEQAVLQSPEVQAWKKDAERLKYLLDKVCMYQAASYGCKFEILNLPVHWGDCERDCIPPFLAAIDAEMEKQK